MIKITITIEAFEAIARTLPLGSVNFEAQGDLRHIWLDPAVLNQLRALRGPGESYSDVIMRVAAEPVAPAVKTPIRLST